MPHFGNKKLCLITALIMCAGCVQLEGIEKGNLSDASDNPQDAHPYTGPVCCQINKDFTDDPYWHNGLYGCDTDGSLAVNTAAPWVCNVNDYGMCNQDSGLECLTCNQPDCIPGLACLGPNGTGIVTDCQPGD